MTEETPSPVTAPSKSDPETLVLRGERGRVVRFRKGAIVAVVGLGSVAVVSAAWFGLSPTTFRVAAHSEDHYDLPMPPDELVTAPKSYGDIPKLGPPLPGDLGRPILERQRAMAMASPTTQDGDQGRRAEEQRREADLRSARESSVMMQVSSPQASRASVGLDTATPAGGDAVSTSQSQLGPVVDPNGQQQKIDFAARLPDNRAVSPARLAPASSPFTLSAGTVLSASLVTGLNSDLPGMVIAQVTENAYDSVTGRVLLVPQGARLLGRYDSVVAFGQSRALVVWDRLLLPDGSSIRIDNMPASDTSGYAGLADKLDRHSFQILKGVALSTFLGLGSELSIGNEDGDIISALRRSAQQSGSRAGDQLVGRSLDIQPTIRVRPGWPLRVIVNKDLVLRPWRREGI